jgi:hypothetical protein
VPSFSSLNEKDTCPYTDTSLWNADLYRDSREETRNLLESGETDGSFQYPEELMVTRIVPLLCPGLLPRTSALLTSALLALPCWLCLDENLLCERIDEIVGKLKILSVHRDKRSRSPLPGAAPGDTPEFPRVMRFLSPRVANQNRRVLPQADGRQRVWPTGNSPLPDLPNVEEAAI